MKKTKKQLVTTTLLVIVIACMLGVCGCSKNETVYDPLNDTYVEVEFDNYTQVPGYDYLYYSLDSHQVYYFEDDVLTEYYINSHPCKYIGGNLEEIVDNSEAEP